jgi:hypothetical protein
MLPDPRWDDAMAASSAHQFIPKPCQYIELVSRNDDDVEVITGELEADAVVLWLNDQVSLYSLHSRRYADIAALQS